MPKHTEGVVIVLMTEDSLFLTENVIKIFCYTTIECFHYVKISLVFSGSVICMLLF